MGQKIVLITGVSKGIGYAMAKNLLESGYTVIGAARTMPKGLDGLEFYQADLSNEAELTQFTQTIKNKDIYALINNAAIVHEGLLEEVTVADLRQAVRLNVEVPILLAQSVVGRMKKNKLGRIVNISSRAALGKSSRTIYSFTKSGLLGMTRTWALELAPFGITVNAVSPGPIATEFFDSVNAPDDPATQSLINAIPVGRVGSAEEIAAHVAHLLDERSGFITGQNLIVCGGLTI